MGGECREASSSRPIAQSSVLTYPVECRLHIGAIHGQCRVDEPVPRIQGHTLILGGGEGKLCNLGIESVRGLSEWRGNGDTYIDEASGVANIRYGTSFIPYLILPIDDFNHRLENGVGACNSE